MSGVDLLVIAAGVAAIALVNWWFFIAGDRQGRGDAQHHHH